MLFDRREERTVGEAMAEGAGRAGKAQPAPEGPEIDAVLRAFKARHYATWADESAARLPRTSSTSALLAPLKALATSSPDHAAGALPARSGIAGIWSASLSGQGTAAVPAGRHERSYFSVVLRASCSARPFSNHSSATAE